MTDANTISADYILRPNEIATDAIRESIVLWAGRPVSARSCSKTSLCCEAHRGTMRRGISARAAPAAHRRGAVSTAAVHVRARTRRKSA